MEKETFVEMEIGERVYKIGNLGTILGANGNPLKQRLNRDGYLEVTLGNGEKNKRSTYRVHRLVAQCFVPNPNKEEFLEVNHIDYNRANPRYDNLEWTSHRDNVRHSSKTGSYSSSKLGEKNGRSVMTEELVRKCRELYDTGNYTIMELSKRFNICWSTMSYCVKRKSWKHI